MKSSTMKAVSAAAAILLAPEIPGTKMAFAGIKKQDELANLVAYLKTLPE